MIRSISNLIYLLFLLFFVSCSKNSVCDKMKEHFNEYNYSPDIIRNSKILSRTKIQISSGEKKIVLYAKGKPVSPNRIRAIDHFNESGYLTLSIIPKYEMQKADTNGFSQLSPVEQFFFQKEVESNVPTGQADTIYFYYDKSNRLVKEEIRKQTLFGETYLESIYSYEYDENDNIVKTCVSSDNSPTSCSRIKYEYDESKKIINEVRELPEDLIRNGRPSKIEFKYTYYPDGKLRSMASTYYIYENEKVIEKYEAVNDVKTQIFKYEYDKYGNCIKETKVEATSSGTDSKTKKFEVFGYDTSILQRTYDERQLITEWYYKNKNNSTNYSLYKFQYQSY